MAIEVWERLDEVIGAALLAAIAIYALYIDSIEITGTCVAGIIALLSVKAAVNGGIK